MQGEAFLQQPGLLYTYKHFFTVTQCEQLQQYMRQSPAYKATIYANTSDRQINEDQRRTRQARLSLEQERQVVMPLLALIPDLEHYYQVQIQGLEALQFLRYQPGDYFKPHRDKGTTPKGQKERLVSAVLFLNQATTPALQGDYEGGQLLFYGHNPHNKAELLGFEYPVTTGSLVTFRPDIIHEVTPVTTGERFTVVAWFH